MLPLPPPNRSLHSSQFPFAQLQQALLLAARWPPARLCHGRPQPSSGLLASPPGAAGLLTTTIYHTIARDCTVRPHLAGRGYVRFEHDTTGYSRSAVKFMRTCRPSRPTRQSPAGRLGPAADPPVSPSQGHETVHSTVISSDLFRQDCHDTATQDLQGTGPCRDPGYHPAKVSPPIPQSARQSATSPIASGAALACYLPARQTAPAGDGQT